MGARGKQTVSRLGDIYVNNSNALAQGDCQLILIHQGNVSYACGLSTAVLKDLLARGKPLTDEVVNRLRKDLFEMWLREEGQAVDFKKAMQECKNQEGKAKHAMRMRYMSSLHRRFGKKLWFDILCRYQTIPERIIELVNENVARKIKNERVPTLARVERNLESMAMQLPAQDRRALKRVCEEQEFPFLAEPTGSGPCAEQVDYWSRDKQQYEGGGKAKKGMREEAWLVTKNLAKMADLYCGGDMKRALALAPCNRAWGRIA